jgi:hypothetical protein
MRKTIDARMVGLLAAFAGLLVVTGCKGPRKEWHEEDYTVTVRAEGAHTENVVGVVVAVCGDDCPLPTFSGEADIYREVSGEGTLARKLGKNEARYKRYTLHPTGASAADRSFVAHLKTEGVESKSAPDLIVIANLGKGEYQSHSLPLKLTKETTIEVRILPDRVTK